MVHKVVLSLQGEFISAQAFLAAASDLLVILNELDIAVNGKRSFIWGVTGLKAGSTVLEVSPKLIRQQEPDRSEKVISVLMKGLQEIDKKAVRPPLFSDVALTRAKQLSSINGSVNRVIVRAKTRTRLSKAISITQRVAANVDELIGPRHVATGALEGRLELLSIHGGTFCHIYDLLTGRRIKCICDMEMLYKLAAELGKRVLVFGSIRSDAKGLPVSIAVERFKILRERQDLPQIEDIKGLLSDIPSENGADLGEYLRS